MPSRRRKSCAYRWHSRPRSSATAAFRAVPVEAVVPGDILRVRAGDIIPADALLLESTAFTAGEAALTGEPYPVEKRPGVVTALAAGEASNALFRGAVAQTGEAIALVVSTGRATMFGAAASALAEDAAPSPFQRDLRAFGLLTARMTLGLVLVVLTTHMLFGRPVLESVMFAVALAVGLTPELLPMITTVTLSRGALRMASRKVIVKRLASIHDLGAMTVLCTDKTGTLTSAEIKLARSLNPGGVEDPRAARLGAIAADLGGDRGALDAALVAGTAGAAQGWTLVGRHAFDFNRRLGSVLASGPEGQLLIVKGAPEAVLALCTSRRDGASSQRRWAQMSGRRRMGRGPGPRGTRLANSRRRVDGHGPAQRTMWRARMKPASCSKGSAPLPIRPRRRRQPPLRDWRRPGSGSRSFQETIRSS